LAWKVNFLSLNVLKMTKPFENIFERAKMGRKPREGSARTDYVQSLTWTTS